MTSICEFTLRPVDERNKPSSTQHYSSVHREPPSSSSRSSSSSSSSSPPNAGMSPAPSGDIIHVPDVIILPQGQPGIQNRAVSRPSPPTGHDLMRLFPPPPPSKYSELKGGPTSRFFRRQERAYFAQADYKHAPRPSSLMVNSPAPVCALHNWVPSLAPADIHWTNLPPTDPSIFVPVQGNVGNPSAEHTTPGYLVRRRGSKHLNRLNKPYLAPSSTKHFMKP